MKIADRRGESKECCGRPYFVSASPSKCLIYFDPSLPVGKLGLQLFYEIKKNTEAKPSSLAISSATLDHTPCRKQSMRQFSVDGLELEALHQ